MLETHYESLLVDSLIDTEPGIGFVVTASDVYSAIIYLWKKFSRGYDQLCGFHLLHASDKWLQHLHLFHQIIFNSGIVSDSFCVVTLTPVPEKDKDNRQCCSYRPITVSSVLCKLAELLVIKDVNKACSTPDTQFGFKEGYSREHVHYILANVLMDTEKSGEFLVLAAYDVSRAYDFIVQIPICCIVRSSEVSIAQLCGYLKICMQDYVLSWNNLLVMAT